MRENVGALHKAEIENKTKQKNPQNKQQQKKENSSISDYFSEISEKVGFPLCLEKKRPEFSLAWYYSWSLQFLLGFLEPKDGVHTVLSSTAIRTRCATAQTSAAGLLCW